MEILGIILGIAGLLIFVVGAIWFLVECFRTSILWGLLCLLISPVQIIFLIVHWRVAKKPFGIQLLGVFLLIAASFIFEPEF